MNKSHPFSKILPGSISLVGMILVFLFNSIFWIASARADDFAQRRILGFSPDNRYFAFEQFGVGDPTGIAFSDIFIIDTPKNQWLNNTPFRTRIDPDNNDVSFPKKARVLNAAKAAATIKALKIAPDYRLLASNPMNQEETNPHRISFRISEGKYGPVYDLVLSEFKIKHPRADMPPVTGFTLGIGQFPEPGEKGELVGGYPNIEMPVPKDGFPDLQAVPYYGCNLGYDCASRYAIADVIFSDDFSTMVVLIAVHYAGHNNGHGRYLAIARPWGDWGKLGVAD